MLPSAVATASAPAISSLSWLNPTPHTITVYASPWSSPSTTQHSLPSGRYPLLGPDFRRLDRASFLAHRYEFKQGLLRLDEQRTPDPQIMQTIIDTICAISNVGPEADGFVYLGTADKSADGERVQQLYKIEPIKFDHVSVVGIDREAKQLGIELDKYMRRIEDGIRQSALTDPLKTQVLTALDVVTYRGMGVVRIRVPKQKQVSFVADECFIRVGSSTQRATAPQIAAITNAFGKS